MFSKKTLWITFLVLLVQIAYVGLTKMHIPSYVLRMLFIIVVLVWVIAYYLYSTGSLTEEKLVEKIAEHWDEPLADLHASTKNEFQQTKEVSELTIEEQEDDLRPASPPPTVSGG